MGDLLKLYEQGFQKLQPSVRFEDNLKSTVTAVAGVYTGRAEIGLLGREIWPTEVQAYTSIEGHAPTVIEVATGSYDVPKATYALMIFVNRSNPMVALSTGQLERIFGSPSNEKPVRVWGDLGLKGAWAARPIHLYGFSIDNDKSMIFSQMIFSPGERWNSALHEYVNSSGANPVDAGQLILQAVARDPDGIGISNAYYAGLQVKAIALSTRENAAPIAPTRESVQSRFYPLTRAVYVVIDKAPGHSPSPATLEFLRYVLSRQGQEDVLKEGNYLPLTPEMIAKQLSLLAIH